MGDDFKFTAVDSCRVLYLTVRGISASVANMDPALSLQESLTQGPLSTSHWEVCSLNEEM